MTVLSPTYPGNILICVNCGCLFTYKAQDIYEDNYVYCPLCHEKLKTNIYESAWHFANQEGQPHDKETTIINNDIDNNIGTNQLPKE